MTVQGIIGRLIANKSTEKDVRDHLCGIGYVGATAQFLKLELFAVERPGWFQVYEFRIKAESKSGVWEERYGICRSDDRHGLLEVDLFEAEEDQRAALRRATRGLLTREPAEHHWVKTLLMLVFIGAVAVASIGAMLGTSSSGRAGDDQDNQRTVTRS